MKRFSSVLLFFTFLLIISNSVFAATLWVSSHRAKLKAGKMFSSATIAELGQGTELRLIARGRRWYLVSTKDGRKGWVYRGKVSSIKPQRAQKREQDNSLGDLFGELSGSSINAESVDTSRSIRGLSPEAEEYARQTGSPRQYKAALDQVLATKVTNEELEEFLRKGRIGEYAR